METIAIELKNGPAQGRRVILAPWPLPKTILVDGYPGAYVKVAESQLPAGIPHIIRGATFKWHSDTDN